MPRSPYQPGGSNEAYQRSRPEDDEDPRGYQ